MQNNGVIYLYEIGGQMPIRARHYRHPSERNAIYRDWKKLYSAKIKNCFIQIHPNTDEFLVGKDGKNIQKYGRYAAKKIEKIPTVYSYKEHEEEQVKKPFVRPPAIYKSNYDREPYGYTNYRKIL